MPSRKNIREVEELARLLQESPVVIATGFQGLPVSAMNDLRRRLREKGFRYRVVKNTLVRLAGQRVGKPEVARIVEGPTGLVLAQGDPTEPAKVLDEFVRATRLPLVLRGALVDGQVLGPQEVQALASLPPRPQLMADLLGRLLGPLAALASLLNRPAQSLAYLLQQHAEGGAQQAG